ncbi:uncharacterized protein BJ171DRAFT_421112 [Polychytrium aggregatum]|uniref:uncharacterized protein n=1 Tax=Polychytrium aggregatum TaxID=110093 RepID=UPI0022FF328D|nr:uncharacterized protein BJ171DRAFT_421112 [Polychytrium aggregatum]KAI9207403.1 hypothetical protein BJ171DRAFT_421112 [Polychytrium aggregatum]
MDRSNLAIERARSQCPPHIKALLTPHQLPAEFLSISAWKYSVSGLLLYILASVLTVGIVPLVAQYKIWIWTHLARTRAASWQAADVALIVGLDGQSFEAKIEHSYDGIMMFEFRKQRYFYSYEGLSFERQTTRLPTATDEIFPFKYGLSSSIAASLLLRFGVNEISIDSPPVLSILMEKIMHPFYAFQVFSTLIWVYEAYYTFGIVIMTMSAGSLISEVYSTKTNMDALRALTRVDQKCTIIRDSTLCTVNAQDLVVGDAVILDKESGKQIVCDMVLIQGECTVDESSLTGEAAAVVKTPIVKGTSYGAERNRGHTLFGGSTMVEAKIHQHHPEPFSLEHSTIGIVVSTGFSSSKGELFRSIIFPPLVKFKFQTDSYKYLLIMAIVAVLAFSHRMITGQVQPAARFGSVLLSALDLITIAVPPSLPLVLTIGTGFSLARLKKQKIHCINPERINCAGRIDLMCWDKTGTLTTSSLRWKGCVPSTRGGAFSKFFRQAPPESLLEKVVAACHSLQPVGGAMAGHVVDQEMFSASGWTLHPDQDITIGEDIPILLNLIPGTRTGERSLRIIKRFLFDAHVQRSSVIALTAENIPLGLIKGSPEAIRDICNPSSIPDNFEEVFKSYSSQGYYVLACASTDMSTKLSLRNLTADALSNIKRDQVDEGAQFQGFIIMENPVKPESVVVVETLTAARIRSIIITGDNVLTAINVARELRLATRILLIEKTKEGLRFSELTRVDSLFESAANLDALVDKKHVEMPKIDFPIEDLPHILSDNVELAIVGDALEHLISCYEKPFIDMIITRTSVFARTNPNHKTWIVERLMKLGRYVAMCGDGTNDCGALKAAHVGLALSSAEASIIAPFTSAKKSISDLPLLLAEGRCALETSLTAFKVMMITATLYQFSTAISNNQFLFDDMVIVFLLALLMLYTGPAHRFTIERPTDDLFSLGVLSSLLGQIAICMGIFMYVVRDMVMEPWFCSAKAASSQLGSDWKPLNPGGPANVSYPWYFASVALAFTAATKFRRPFWTNPMYSGYLLLLFALLSYMILADDNTPGANGLRQVFSLRAGVPFNFRLKIWGMVVLNVLASVVWELVVVDKVVSSLMREREELVELERRYQEVESQKKDRRGSVRGIIRLKSSPDHVMEIDKSF